MMKMIMMVMLDILYLTRKMMMRMIMMMLDTPIFNYYNHDAMVGMGI